MNKIIFTQSPIKSYINLSKSGIPAKNLQAKIVFGVQKVYKYFKSAVAMNL